MTLEPLKHRTPEEMLVYVERAMVIAEGVKPWFAGEPPEVVGAALAELMAIFLYGHRIPDNAEDQEDLREAMLGQWCNTVRQLIAVRDREG